MRLKLLSVSDRELNRRCTERQKYFHQTSERYREFQKLVNLPVLQIRDPKSIYPLSMQNLIERKKTVTEVADLLRKTPQVIEQMARRKEIPAPSMIIDALCPSSSLNRIESVQSMHGVCSPQETHLNPPDHLIPFVEYSNKRISCDHDPKNDNFRVPPALPR